MSKESEEYRLQMLRHLQARLGRPKPSEVLEAEQVVAKFRKEEEEAGAQIARLGLPLPNPDLCPQCFYLHGRSSKLSPARAKDAANFDKFECRVCGHSFERRM
jgi:hypothetical protein